MTSQSGYKPFLEKRNTLDIINKNIGYYEGELVLETVPTGSKLKASIYRHLYGCLKRLNF